MSKFKSICAAAIVTAIFSAPATQAVADVTLRYSNWVPATHPFTDMVIKPWIAEVERATEGRVKIEMLPKVVGTVPTQFEVIRDRLADVSLIVDGYSPGRFKLSGIVELPFLGSDSRATSVAYWRIYQKYLKPFGEFEGVTLVGTGSSGASALLTSSGPIADVEQIKGLKLRVPTTTGSKVVSAMGGVPVNKPISEMYELISTGIVDGMLAPAETIRGFKLADYINHVLLLKGGFSGATISFIVNEDALNSIPPEDLEAFWSVSGEVLTRSIADGYEEVNAGGMADVEAAGGSVSAASPEMEAALREVLGSLDAEWVAQAKEVGLENPEEVLAEFRAEIAKLGAELEKD